MIIKPHVAGTRHGNQIDILSLPKGATPDYGRALDKAIERFPQLLEKIQAANRVPCIMSRRTGIVHKIDNSTLLCLAVRRHDEVDIANRQLLDKNLEFAKKVHDSIPENEKELGNEKIIIAR